MFAKYRFDGRRQAGKQDTALNKATVPLPHTQEQGSPIPLAVRLASTYSVPLTGLVADQAHLAEEKRETLSVAVLCRQSLDRFVLPCVQCSPAGLLALCAAPCERVRSPGRR